MPQTYSSKVDFNNQLSINRTERFIQQPHKHENAAETAALWKYQ
jgi:hypothetical protein